MYSCIFTHIFICIFQHIFAYISILHILAYFCIFPTAYFLHIFAYFLHILHIKCMHISYDISVYFCIFSVAYFCIFLHISSLHIYAYFSIFQSAYFCIFCLIFAYVMHIFNCMLQHIFCLHKNQYECIFCIFCIFHVCGPLEHRIGKKIRRNMRNIDRLGNFRELWNFQINLESDFTHGIFYKQALEFPGVMLPMGFSMSF